MDFQLGPDPKVVFAFWLGVGLVTVTLIMLAVILLMRQIALHQEKVHAKAMAFWRDIVMAAPGVAGREVPALRNRDLSGFLELWNEVHEPLQGDTTPYLSSVASQTGLEKHLHRILDRDNFHNRLVAVIALGHVKNGGSFDRVAAFIDNRSSVVSLCAARALIQIDSARAVALFVPQIVHRGDWPQGSVATILHESIGATVPQELAEVTLRANADIAPRLIRFLAGVSEEAVTPIIRQHLASPSDERMISTCLQVMSDPGLLDCVRPLLSHPRWHIRMQAAVTLGRLGVPGDESLLVPMLSDAQWWVRYRTAQALMKLSFLSTDNLREIQHAQSDPYARDIIDHVLAEAIPKAAA